jgi:hypothetical protein
MNIFIPYNKNYILSTYNSDSCHIAFVEEALRTLLNRLIKSKIVNRVDVYSQDKSITKDINSKKLNFIESISNELESSEEIIKDYLSITKMDKPFVYYNLMFPFTDVNKLQNALDAIETGRYESATGVIDKGIVWSSDSAKNSNPLTPTPSQKEIDTMLDVGSFCILKPDNILHGYRRTTPPVMLVPLSSLELVNLRGSVDKELYELIISSGMPL